MSDSARYQSHIDGLRAVAVLCVIFYHFGHPLFGGGFVGVDVFFVISGFLITRLIRDEILDTSSFDFKRFYIRRLRRLFPALLATLFMSLPFAIALLSPERFQQFGRSLAAAAFSVSNVLFWTESGYFDADARTKPLLHTWSLGVEEQFYLLWPALLWLIARGAVRRWQPYVLALVGIGSLALNHVWVVGDFDPEYASTIFYLTPFRIFELTMGAMIIFAAPWFGSRRWLCEPGMLLGLVLIGAAVFTYSDSLTFPYYYALVPCTGAFLVILSGESRWFGWILTNPMAVGVGLISYSMYLVHWPALVFLGTHELDALSGIEQAGALAGTILLATLIYFFVEQPLRRNAPARSSPAPQRAFVLASLGMMAGVGLVGVQIGASAGWVWRHPDALTATAISEGRKLRFSLVDSGCNLMRLADPRYCRMDRPVQILVFGDSRETDGYNAFAAVYGDQSTVNLISFGALNRCDVQFDDSVPFSSVDVRNCRERVSMLSDMDFVASLDLLVYSSNMPFGVRRETTWRIIRHLEDASDALRVVVMGGYITTRRACSELFSEFRTFDACKDPRFVAYEPFDEREVSLLGGLDDLDYLYIDTARLLCPRGTLDSCLVEANGEPVFYDRQHFSLGFATHLGERMADVYGEELGSIGVPITIPSDRR